MLRGMGQLVSVNAYNLLTNYHPLIVKLDDRAARFPKKVLDGLDLFSFNC